jgi:hypothetical protein
MWKFSPIFSSDEVKATQDWIPAGLSAYFAFMPRFLARFWPLLTVPFLLHCMDSTSSYPRLEVLSSRDLPTISSGSGMALWEGKLFMVGDDAPNFYEFSPEGDFLVRYGLFVEHLLRHRIPKDQKPDLESLFLATADGTPTFFSFGSGSKSPQRDVLLQLPLQVQGGMQLHNLTPFYDRLCLAMGIGREQLNLEGSLVMDEALLLFNRGTNTVIRLSWPLFLQHLAGALAAEALPLELYRLQLPKIGITEARFSGACQLPGTSKILFTATVEDTDNWIDDGDVLGSFIGLFDSAQLADLPTPEAWLLADAQGQPLAEKLESLAVLEQHADQLLLLAVADNDRGSSRLFRLRIRASFAENAP